MNKTLIQEPEAMLAVIKSLPGNYLILLPDAPKYTIADMSDEYNRVTLSSRDEIIGMGIFEAFPDDPSDPSADGVKNLSRSFDQVLSTGMSHQMPIQRYSVQHAGSGEFVEKFWAPINKPVVVGGEIAYIIHSVTDVTESRALASREHYFKALAEESPFMIWRSAGGSCIYVNNVWTEITGLSLADSLGSGHLKACHPDDVEEQKRLFNKALADNSSYETKLRIIDRDGKHRYAFMKVAPFHADGESIEFIGSLIDITELEIASHRIADREQQLRQLADSIIQMIWVTDAQGMHEYYNQRWYDFTGTTYQETEGEGWNQVFHPEDQDRAWKVWRHSLDTGEPYEIEYRLKKYTGEYVWVLGRAAPYYDKEGKIVKWFGTCTDIHEQKLLQQQKDDFINIASHELKTPITSLSANIQFLQKYIDTREAGDPTIAKLVSASFANVKKLNRLVDELLNANSIGLGQLALKKEEFDLIALIKETIEYSSTDNQKLILSGEDKAFIFADPGKIEQVIVNLVNNAQKYAKVSEVVELKVARIPEGFKICVDDKGPGIAEDQLPFLFDRYYKTEKRAGRYSGMGLGLFICASIVRSHDGKIGVDSKVGRGSSFWFTLPQ